jgi:predicted GNAT family N-acyltransferase
MRPEFHLIHTSWQESELALNAVRRAVFIEEQRVPAALEWDGLDAACHHVLVTAAGHRPVGTGRMKPDGHIGRMAVLKDYRGQGIGSAILTALLDFARQQHCARVYLHAQVAAIVFYEKHGFTVDSEEFMDAGMPHRNMVKRLVSQDQCALSNS